MVQKEDIELAKALLPDLAMSEVAEKLEVPLHELAQAVLDCDFIMSESLFRKRLKAGRIRLADDSVERLCTVCNEYSPYVFEFWHRANRSADGAHSMCRCCEHERKAAKRLAAGIKPRPRLYRKRAQ